MSFKQYTSAVDIANRALGMISEAKTISSLEDPGHNAQVVRRWYKPVVARLLEMHHWGLATKRASLVQIPSFRDSEWLYAFAAPIDLAFPVGIGLASGVSSMSYYRGLAGLIALTHGKQIFKYHNGVIHSNMVGDLEYVSYDITEADFNATFENIVILSLASRLATEIVKDYDLSQELAKAAMTEINIAITQNLNTGNRKYGQIISETELVRGEWGHSWDYIPLGPPR